MITCTAADRPRGHQAGNPITTSQSEHRPLCSARQRTRWYRSFSRYRIQVFLLVTFSEVAQRHLLVPHWLAAGILEDGSMKDP